MQSKASAAPKSRYCASSANDDVPVALRATTFLWPCRRSVRRTATPAVVLPTSDEVPSVQRLAAVAIHRAKVAHAAKVRHFQMRPADQLADHPGVRENPVVVTWNEPIIGDAADGPTPCCTVPWRS